jgi:aspartate aminotransferase
MSGGAQSGMLAAINDFKEETMGFASRVEHLRAEGAYAVLARAQALEAQGREIIHLEIGQPDFQTFSNISLAGVRAIAAGKTGYSPYCGLPALREAIARYAGRLRGITVGPEQVVVGPGAKTFLYFPMLTLLEPGDEVIYPNPGFPTYEVCIRHAGGKPVPVPLLEEDGFSFDLDAFDRLVNDKTRMIVLNTPANPTGGIISQADLERIAEAARRFDCWVMSDEIYSCLVYDGAQAPTIAALPGMMERTILVDGFSKTYSMTGWRLGYGIVPEDLAERLGLLLNHSIGCTATFTQYAGIEALTGPQGEAEAARAIFQERRDFIVAGLNAIPGVTCQKPQGAFYAFPNVKSFGWKSGDLADYLLDEAGVALLPGTDFGEYGEGHLRLSYANSVENIEKALERIGEALGKL